MEDCSICMLTMKDDISVSLKCNHSFHLTCLVTWGKIRQNCPLCRGELGQFNKVQELAHSGIDTIKEARRLIEKYISDIQDQRLGEILETFHTKRLLRFKTEVLADAHIFITGELIDLEDKLLKAESEFSSSGL